MARARLAEPAPPLAHALAPLLRTARFGRAVRAFEETPSTNAEATRWAEAGAPEGALVMADHQTAGRGRYGRSWVDAPGQGLLFSLVLRPALPPDALGLLPLMAGVAVAEAAAPHVAPHAPRLKWPNDLLFGGRKAGGLLAEARTSGDGRPVVILGVGLNVNEQTLPPEIEDRATSLALVLGRPLDRAALLAGVLLALERRYDALLGGGRAALLAAFEAHAAGLGKAVTVSFPHGPRPALTGTFAGLAPDGALRLATRDSEVHVHAGEVTLALAG
ncbi:MAG TPA: biotin--[acetyl-CoA-carboxylase] ligase [Rubricoccaceae bacterium]|nr:biotin--[acetyl-CoA-carboxylase] ligase [Rubricoccaceae bacterium]